ncbi:hypothetical protein, partial [Xanthomonas hortorum]|uniref:hypothetical protein n=1 Tax=Xanthomonas hortorum TaxID=56454 RepID=UPI0032E90BCC
MTSPMSITTLAALASAGVLRTVQLVGQVGGYTVMVRVGQTEKQLTGQRGEPRVFASLDTAATQLLALGVTVFEVLPANYVRAPKVYRRGRPAALKELAKIQREGKPRVAFGSSDLPLFLALSLGIPRVTGARS